MNRLYSPPAASGTLRPAARLATAISAEPRLAIAALFTNTITVTSQMGASDSADPTTVIGDGSIVIHK